VIGNRIWTQLGRRWFGLGLTPVVALGIGVMLPLSGWAASPPTPDQVVDCDILVGGGGLAGSAAAYESLLAGRTVCLTEITDWVGGQLSAQGTSALDEAKKQRSLSFFPRGYNELRQRITQKYGKLNPGDCWVSESCFLPKDGHAIVWDMLQQAAKAGKGKLKWFPNTVIKELRLSVDGRLISDAIAIQHQPAPNAPALNTLRLSETLEDSYRYEDSKQLSKTIVRFVPRPRPQNQPFDPKTVQGPEWLVIEATETGELVALADVPYRLGLDPRTPHNPSAAVLTNDPYCTQGFTYTFAMEQTAEPQSQVKPAFYETYQPYYGYDADRRKADFNFVFTYRRIWAPTTGPRIKAGPMTVNAPLPGHISMQNWVWGNDYRPGTASDNLIYSREQLLSTGQLLPGGWMGGLRGDTLRRGEESALGFYYWLTAGTTDSQLGDGVKQSHPNQRLLQGPTSPMGTEHGLSKYPYIRESRRIIGRPSLIYPQGFSIDEIDISSQDFRDAFYRQALSESEYRSLWVALSGLEMFAVVRGEIPIDAIKRRTRSTIYPDSVGISQYAIDFHPCMELAPPEAPGNQERPGVRQAHGQSYPAQIPLRAMIPQRIDNLLVAGKSMAMSNIAAAAYRVHSFEWSSGAAAGTVAAFSLSHGVFPSELVDGLPSWEPLLAQLRQQLAEEGNPIEFPNTSIFNLEWSDWKVW
jgi:hypothetical protein